MAKGIGAYWLVFQDVEDLKQACLEGSKTQAKQFDCSVFDGEYVTGDVDEAYLARLLELRNDESKKKTNTVENVNIDLHNDSEVE